MGTDRKNAPRFAPSLYRSARFDDITDASVRGFYLEDGEYWRKNGMAHTYKRDVTRAYVPVKFGLYSYARIDKTNLHLLYVRIAD